MYPISILGGHGFWCIHDFFLVIATIVIVMLDICLVGPSETFGYLDDGRTVMDMFVGPLLDNYNIYVYNSTTLVIFGTVVIVFRYPCLFSKTINFNIDIHDSTTLVILGTVVLDT